MFLDEATIAATGGKGGSGCVSWRREKYIPLGGPNGGDGGKGGNVLLVADANTDTLSNFSSRKRFAAEAGEGGKGKDCHGKNGKDLLLPTPPGTIVTDAKTGEILADLKAHGDRVIVATGGRGGFGNAHFKSSTRRKPDFAEKGESGEEKTVKLDLKLVADVGIIGFPNVGKSTFISAVSSARPKIANYPFTTLVPNLGVARVSGRSFILCDIPGLIEGASEGKGLGDQFLRHIERCGILVHLLDLSKALTPDGTLDPAPLIRDYRTIRKELKEYSPALEEKLEIVALNKIDLTIEPLTGFLRSLKQARIPVSATISAATKSGTEAFLKKLLPLILRERKKRDLPAQSTGEEIPILRPHEESSIMRDFTVDESDAKVVRVRGTRIEQFTHMTDFDNEGGIKRFLNVLKRVGLLSKLKRAKSQEKEVFIGTKNVGPFL